jgi:nucleotide-binding universal stress UspA family protein
MAAVEWTAAEAATSGAHVTLAHSVSPWLTLAFSIPPLNPDELETMAADRLDGEWSEPLRRAGVSFDIELHHAKTAELLGEVAAETRAGLIVVGRHGHGQWSPQVLGSVAHNLLLTATCPLVVVPADWKWSEPGTPGRVVVGVDGSIHSISAFDWALAHARGRPLEVVAITGVHIRQFGQEPWLGRHEEIIARKTAVEGLASIVDARAAKTDVTIESVVEFGHPQAVLTEHSADADLVVVGSRGLGSIGRLTGGSVAQYVATHASAPVVIVP